MDSGVLYNRFTLDFGFGSANEVYYTKYFGLRSEILHHLQRILASRARIRCDVRGIPAFSEGYIVASGARNLRNVRGVVALGRVNLADFMRDGVFGGANSVQFPWDFVFGGANQAEFTRDSGVRWRHLEWVLASRARTWRKLRSESCVS